MYFMMLRKKQLQSSCNGVDTVAMHAECMTAAAQSGVTLQQQQQQGVAVTLCLQQ